MIGLGLISMFVVVAAAVVLAWLPLLLWRLIGNTRRRPAEPACARCSYPTTTVTTGRCPECGADLVRDGVITPSMRVKQGGGVLFAAASWSIIVGMGAMILASWASLAIPIPMEMGVNVRGNPVSNQYGQFMVRGRADTSGRFFMPGMDLTGEAEMTLVVVANDGTRHERTFTRTKGDPRVRLDDGRVIDDYQFNALTTEDVVKEVLSSAGAKADDVATQHEASEIAQLLNGGGGWWFMQSQNFASVANSTALTPMSNMYAMVAGLVPTGVLLLGAGAWLAGVIILFNQHGKRFRRRHTRGGPATASAPAVDPAGSTA